MSSKRDYGDGGIEQRGPNTFRLRYRVGGRRFSKTMQGTRAEAKKELHRLVEAVDDGRHVAPDKLTLSQWVDQWIEIKSASKSARLKTAMRYREILDHHVLPTLGDQPVQKIETSDINHLYAHFDEELSSRSRHHVHVVLKACLRSAVKNKKIAANPAADAEAPKVVPPDDGDDDGEEEIGQVLEAEQLAALVKGFQGRTIYDIVALAAFTGMRRGEVLALRWSDFDAEVKTLRIARALEYTRKKGLAFKPPKTARGRRTITIDDSLIELLLKVQEKHKRIVAGIPDSMPGGSNSAVALGLVRLPDTALVFPAPDGDLTSPRHPDAVTKQFMKHAEKLGFPGFRFHDLRGTCECLQLDAGVPVHVVAARTGHDPAVLLRWYAKRTKKSDQTASDVIGALTKTVL
jgi:integrase